MRTPAPHVSIADLAAAGLRLRPAEAVTVARELVLRASRGELAGIPSAHVIRFNGEGQILVEGPVAAGGSVERAARLLEAMLPGFDAPPEFRVPGALRLVLARALGTLDLPPYVTLTQFADALSRFAAPDSGSMVRELVAVWTAAIGAGTAAEEEADHAAETADTELTISDVRRARRSTGLTLMDVSERSRIPISLLRELEWGLYGNWPTGHYGRTQLVRYARAAGLDEQLIVRTVLPEIEASAVARAMPIEEPVSDRVETDRVESVPEPVKDPIEGTILDDEREPAGLVRIGGGVPAVVRTRTHRGRWAAALAIPALIAIGVVPAYWNSDDGDRQRDTTVPATEVSAPRSTPVTARPASVPGKPAATSGEGERPSHQDARPARTEAVPAALRGDAAFSPAFATEGSAVFYHAKEGGGSAIMRADTDGAGAVLRITSIVNDDANNFHARPSPDGRFIAFDSDRDGERAVYIADADGRNVRRITGEGFAAVPSWSPDGSTLAYVRAEPGEPNVWNIWTVQIETGETRRITSHSIGQPWGAAWFPDGKRIAYSHENRLIVRSLEGKGSERIYSAPRKNGWIRTPAVSPDGTRIIFQLHRDGAWLLDLRDGSMRKVLSDPSAEEFTWSPGGRQVAYHSRKTGKWGVWIMTAG